jgi:hypothetical protein
VSRNKRSSRRRWKARCALGRVIPAIAIVEHDLGRWFAFTPVDVNADVYTASRRRLTKAEVAVNRAVFAPGGFSHG